MREYHLIRATVLPVLDNATGSVTPEGLFLATKLTHDLRAHHGLILIPSDPIAESIFLDGLDIRAISDGHGVTRLCRFQNIDAIIFGELDSSGRDRQIHLRLLDAQTGSQVTDAYVRWTIPCDALSDPHGDISCDSATIAARLAKLGAHINDISRNEGLRAAMKELSVDIRRMPGDTSIDFVRKLSMLETIVDAWPAYSDNRIDTARAACIHVLWQDRKHPDALDLLALSDMRAENFSDARRHLARAIESRRASHGDTHPSLAVSLGFMATLQAARGDTVEAESLWLRAIHIVEGSKDADSTDAGSYLSQLATVYQHQDRFADAERAHRKAVDVLRSTLGPRHPRVADAIFSHANLYRNRRMYRKAEPLYRQAMDIRESVFGPEHPKTIACLTHIVMILERERRYAGAEPLFRRMLSYIRGIHGESSAETSRSLRSLARLYVAQKRFAEAEPLLLRASQVLRSTLGEGHPDVGETARELAACRNKRKSK